MGVRNSNSVRIFTRNQLTDIAGETLSVLDSGLYYAPDGELVSIEDDLKKAVSGTKFINQNWKPTLSKQGSGVIEVLPLLTTDALIRLHRENPDGRTLVLNFASAKNPGGGFENGASAQEESLARQSGLYAAIRNRSEFYGPHRNSGDPLYSDRMLYSPLVPFFRNGDDELLDVPVLADILTVAAPNATAARNQGIDEQKITESLQRRIERLIFFIAERNPDRAVLGAFGCGVFGNDSATTAKLFKKAIAESGGAVDYSFAIPPGDNLDFFRSVFSDS